MATVIPFKGLRYNPEKIKVMADVVTPPYDVIGSEAQDCYYKRNSHNIIRLEYGKTKPDDNASNNRYTRAAGYFQEWTKNNVLLCEKDPALYLYEQEFCMDGVRKIRTGFIGAVRLETYDKGIVLPHEETIPKHKADRLDLMRACQANFSPVFGLYADAEKKVEHALREAVADDLPELHFTDEMGQRHRVWAVTDPIALQEVQKALDDKQIFIADGHHRYETALNYRNEQAAACNLKETDACNYAMMTLVNLYDAGLVVLPTHRLIKNVAGLDIDRLLERIEDNFTIEEYHLDSDEGTLPKLMGLMAERGQGKPVSPKSQPGTDDPLTHPHVFGLYAGANKFYLLQLKQDRQLTQLMAQKKSPVWMGLDVSILHTLVIDKLLGIDNELMAKAEHITYTRSEEDAVALVDTGTYQLALFMNPTLVEEVTKVANNGEKMPQKSTFFYPKLITGLVINRL